MNHNCQAKLFSIVLVGLQALTSAAVVLAIREPAQHAIGIAFAAGGVVVGSWAIITIGVRRVSVLPELRQGAELATTGPYRWVRHPMYAALLMFVGGLACSPFAAWKGLAWCLLLLVLFAKSRLEERELKERFADYPNYAKRTKRIIPFLF
ncbi:MAG: isoprenylcysteine carboxylmethyltransferase family protein [Pirellulaceae bacterium]